ncbi:MAG TPA: acyl-CoA dehydrogenase family protein [Ilumatobacteraceae bacterium]|nr:acyl-CoA dehydrogenase family protein [Ilumatobacteraceae bacterium]
MSITATEHTTIRDQVLDRIRELRPLFEANAARTEADRRVVEENITALRAADAFRIMLPKRFGGLETDIRTKLEVSREVAMGCGSTAWVTALMNVCAFFVSLGNEQLQHDVWGSDPDARISGVFNPTATTKRVDGGYIVNGAWNWTSGCLHSDWAFLGVPLVNEAGEFVMPAMALMPYAELEIEDTWFTTGMRGTASNTVHARDVFVPDHRLMSVPGLLTHDYDTPFKDEVLYRSAFIPVAALILVGPLLGLAQAALDYVIEKGHKRGIAYTEYEVQRDAPTFQLAIAKAATLVDTAHLFAYRAAGDIDDAARADRAMTYVERARVRMDTGHAAETAREAIRVLCSAHGASSFAESSPMQRWWRDAEIASRHAVVSPEISAQVYGRALMGFTDGVTFLV